MNIRRVIFSTTCLVIILPFPQIGLTGFTEILAAAFFLLYISIFKIKNFLYFNGTQQFFLVWVFLGAMLSTIFSSSMLSSIPHAARWIFVCVVIYPIACECLNRGFYKELVFGMANVFMGIGLVSCYLLWFDEADFSGRGRFNGPLGDPQATAFYMAPLLPFAMTCVLDAWQRKKYIFASFLILLTVLSIWALLHTASRTAFLCVLIVVAAYSLLLARKLMPHFRAFVLLILTLSCTLSALLIYHQSDDKALVPEEVGSKGVARLTERVLSSGSLDSNIVAPRIELLIDAIRSMEAVDIAVGKGLDAYTLVTGTTKPHNVFLLVFVEGGGLMAFGFLGVTACAIWAAIKTLLVSVRSGCLRLEMSYSLSILCISIVWLFNTNTSIYYFYLVIFILTSYVLKASKSDEKENIVPAWLRRPD